MMNVNTNKIELHIFIALLFGPIKLAAANPVETVQIDVDDFPIAFPS